MPGGDEYTYGLCIAGADNTTASFAGCEAAAAPATKEAAMIISTTLHGCHTEPLKAVAEVHGDVAWLALTIGEATFNLFMPAKRAVALAEAITKAETL